MIDKIGLSLLTMFGIGYFKYAPGTAASFITCLIYYILWLSDFSLHSNKIYLVFFLIIILFYSIIIIDKLSHLFKKKDPREIVVDEFVGQSIPLMSFIFSADTFVPIGEKTDNLIIFILLSFFLFRFFDIFKPFFIGYFDKNYKNSFGIMFDDVLAGVYTAIMIFLSLELFKFL